MSVPPPAVPEVPESCYDSDGVIMPERSSRRHHHNSLRDPPDDDWYTQPQVLHIRPSPRLSPNFEANSHLQCRCRSQNLSQRELGLAPLVHILHQGDRSGKNTVTLIMMSAGEPSSRRTMSNYSVPGTPSQYAHAHARESIQFQPMLSR